MHTHSLHAHFKALIHGGKYITSNFELIWYTMQLGASETIFNNVHLEFNKEYYEDRKISLCWGYHNAKMN